MVKKIILISFSVFIISCSAIGRGFLIDSILNKMMDGSPKEKQDCNKKKSDSKPVLEEEEEDNYNSEEDDDDA
ncbi:hypothetical protein OY14_04645 (plasmid) [Borreliella chilensis]|uniref:Lipoprotein n=1 Tax=Borreliella chilensis TaxID=1245910 RepID=A0A0A7V3F8_9SPIR|nr:hypothetical protein OY14_04645 [Borreliella chilensis]